jgi:hypothetical protein
MIQREAYKGPEFSIEWYFDEKEKSQALEYFLDLSLRKEKGKCSDYSDLLQSWVC